MVVVVSGTVVVVGGTVVGMTVVVVRGADDVEREATEDGPEHPPARTAPQATTARRRSIEPP